ncbi:metallophosphoesterase [Isosphaeraceae bacterium EP7]
MLPTPTPKAPRVWAIADLHLSTAAHDPRERFAGRWGEHADRIEREWRKVVGRQDLVLLPGDLSMARGHKDLQPDLAWLDRLPGLKVMSPGNHDRWFNKVEAVRPMLRRSLRAVCGDAVEAAGAIVCGALGAPVPADDPEPNPSAVAALDRQLAALDRALAHAATLRTAGQPLYVLWHYPPFDQFRRPGPVVDRLRAAGVDACVYGHLHIEGQWSLAVQGVVDGVRYHLVAADAVGFRPLDLGPIPGEGKPPLDVRSVIN